MSSKFKQQKVDREQQKDLHQKTHEKIDTQTKPVKPSWVKPTVPKGKITPKDLEPEIREVKEEVQNTPPRSPTKIYSISSFEETEDLKELLKQTITICHQISTLHLETAKANLETANQVKTLSDSVNNLNEIFSRQLQEPVQVNNRITASATVSRPKTPRYNPTYTGDLSQTITLPVRSNDFARSKSISITTKRTSLK